MAKIESNDIKDKIYLEINLTKNNLFDYKPDRDDSENWIPFYFNINIWNEKIQFSKKMKPTFTLFELKVLLKKIESILLKKSRNERCEDLQFSCLENYFEINITDLEENDLMEVSIWIPKGELTCGKEYGYDFGYRFTCNTKSVQMFSENIHDQLKKCFEITVV